MPFELEFELVFDPIPQETGGMIPGKLFSRQEIRNMLAMRVLAYGTIIKYLVDGTEYRVDYNAEMEH